MTDINYIEHPEPWVVNTVGFAYIALILILGFLCYKLWPLYMPGDDNVNKYVEQTSLFGTTISLKLEQRTVLLVLITGAIGSFIHLATSFTNFVGEKKLGKRWIWWYALRPFVGMAVALVFYLVFRGGLLTNTQAENLNIYGILTLAALAGLFTDRATLKLKEIFETMFKPKDDRSGKLTENEISEVDRENAKG